METPIAETIRQILMVGVVISIEEKLLVNILYRSERELLNGIILNNVNFENLIKLASRHLMLPALFYNINKKNASHLFPKDFIACIKDIYTINKARNEVLLSEAKELSELLFENNIKHIFLKGTALLLANVFEDIGERMIGDIDFIIQHKDEKNIEIILEQSNYVVKTTALYRGSIRVFKPKHLARRNNINKIIAVEPHLELLAPGWRGTFNSKKLISTFQGETKTLKSPSKSFLFDHCIYALQIEDNGFFNSYHSHRSIYDIYKLNCKTSLTVKNIKKNIYIKHFFLTIAKFKIFDMYIKTSYLDLYYDKLFRGVRRFSLILILRNTNIILKNIVNLFFSSKYREGVSTKIINHYRNKTLLKWLTKLLQP